ncbi:hypothetical protein C9374_013536 [Naegleria lovaniensis]|uniref:Uncharacterized protein n=1 Tax=Naegleria lovaniensis TaxID=51637 RepID=A0AA88H2W6_NAELO|nr:uncharacterized protein C9374_013536 [Naegleria lovaniensis]KAG2392051.1 hypothetical protein C9374_013536 [Naegleria lovaniensis]
MAEEGRIQQVWTFILLICSCVIFSSIAILFGILTAAYYDPNEMLNTMSCVVIEPHHECSITPECAGGKVECCTALVSVKPGILFANVSSFQPLRTTLAFTEESTYYNYKANATVTCYNIYADGTVDCGEWDYYSFDIPADVRVQRFYLSFRFTKLNDPSTNDVQAISIFFKLNEIPNITYHDAVTTSPTVPISLDYLQPNSTGYIAVLGRGMCQEGQETTNYYLFQGYLDREGPLPSWAIVIIIVGSGLLFSVVAISLSVAYRHFKHRKRREYERL